MRSFFLLFLFVCISFIGYVQTLTFAFKGTVSNQDLGKNETGVTVSIVQNGNTISSATTASNGKYSLKGNVNYLSPFSVVFSKGGMVSKKVNFNFATMNEEDIPAGSEFSPIADLSMSLFAERPNVDFSFLNNEPVGNVTWNNAKLSPELDKVTSDKMKAKIEKLLMQAEQNNSANEAKYQALIKEADNLYLSLKKYQEAQAKYEEALALKPKEKYPSDKIVELDALIAANQKQAQAAQQADVEYQNLIKAADVLRDQKKYEQAISKYKEAVAKKNEQYPKDQIVAVQKLVDDQKKLAETETKYTEAIKAAELAFTQKNYTLAKEKYTIASELKPAESLPKTKITEIEKILSDQKTLADKKKKFEEAMSAADKLFSSSSWADAKLKYTEASQLDPTATLPKTKITECDAKIALAAKDKEKADKIAKLLSEGSTFFTSSKWTEAKGKYNEVLALDPPNKEAKDKLAEIAVKEQDLAKSAEQEAKFAKFVKDGDASVKTLNYADAKTKYESALAIKSDAAVQTKLDDVNTKIKEKEDKANQEAKFQSLKTEGIQLANESKFSEAKLKLNEALAIKSDVIITAKLKEIDEKEKQLAAGSKLEKDYQDLLAAAEGLENSKDYDGAIQKYKEASAKKPTEKFPKDKIAAIEILKIQNAKQKDVDTKYDAAMKRGDDLMVQQKYLDAIKEYNNALAIKPNETLPVQKAKEAEEAEKSKGSEDRKQYEKIIGGIEKAIAEKDYSRGKELVERAKSFNKQFNIFPSDTRPNDLLTQINLLEQADKNYSAKIAEGEKFVTSKEYTKAVASFEAAKIIKPSETLPQTRIDEVNSLIAANASAKEKERMYSEYMAQGGLSQNAKNYEKAIENYERALSVKPGDKTAQDKISEVKRLMDDLANSAKSAKERQDKFNALIKEADGLFSGKSYSEASVKYSEALNLDAKSSYAKKQLDESNRLKASAEAQKAEEEFKALVKSGDDFFAIKSFDKSKEDFNKALAIKPGNPYVVNKLKEIDAFLNPAMEKSVALQPLGTPYESSIMDGYAALKEAEIQRKNMKDGAVENKVSESVKASSDLKEIQEIKAQSNREKVTNAITTVSTNDQNGDLNRQLTVQVLDKTQKDIETEQIADENFKHSENIRSQESLTTIVDESAIDYKSRESVYSENSETLSTYNLTRMETERQREVGEGSMNVAASQKITEIEKKRQSDAIDDYASRDVARKEVDQKRKEVTELDQTLDQGKKGELLENDRQLYKNKANISEKEVEDAKVAQNNDVYLKQVKSDVNKEESDRSDVQVVHAQELNKSIDDINVSIDQNTVERDLNRGKTTEIIKQGTEEIELSSIATNTKENTKYQSNKSVIDGKSAIASENEAAAKENLAQNNVGVKLIDKKANTSASDLNLSDDQERLDTRKKVEIISSDIEQNSKASEGEQAEFNKKVNDVAKAVEAGNTGLEEANKNKNLANQEKLTEAETQKPEKMKLANSLGQEYPEGVSQESFTQNDSKGLMTAIITRRIVVIEGRGDVYVRTQTLQAITYTKNGQPITETVWQRETQGPHLKKNY